MKRLILLAIAALAAVSASAQMTEAFPSYIQVNGRAEQEITPDEFYLSIVIDERDSKGKVSVESRQRDMSSEFFRRKTSVATAKYQLQLGSAAEVSKVWQALDELGISDVSILKVSHSQIERYKEEVRVEAIRNARQSAATLAEAIGQQVGKCFYIYDSNSSVVPAFYNNKAVMRSAGFMEDAVGVDADEEEPLDFKTIRLQYNVQAKFVLE